MINTLSLIEKSKCKWFYCEHYTKLCYSIDVDMQEDKPLEQKFYDNSFWAKPIDQSHDVDDILAEFNDIKL